MRTTTMMLRTTTALAAMLAAMPAAAVAAVAEAPAPAPASDAAASDAVPSEEGDIIVTGRSETRQVSELGQRDLSVLPAGTSPLKAIQKLPSVNFQSADAFGAYEWSQRVSIRSFNQNQLGFTLDGVPLGDASYGNTNGLHISRAIISENVGRVLVAQGQGSVGTNATNNLGGTVETFSSAPADVFGVQVNGTYGSDQTYRGYVRMDTGDYLGGIRGYLSYGYLKTDKWKGFGQQRAHQVNAKVVAPIGGATLTGYFDFSSRVEQDYQDLSLAQIKRLGYGLDNITNNFPLAVQMADVGANRGDTGAPKLNPAAGMAYPAPFASVDDAYYDASGLRMDYLGYVNLSVPLGTGITASITPYFHDNHGQGTWFTPYVPSPTGVPISVRTTEYDIRRKGVFGSIGATFGDNQLTVGGWYENNRFHQARRYYAVGSRIVPDRSTRSFQSNPFRTDFDFRFTTDTLQYYVDDTLTLGDLAVTAGWKGFRVTNTATPIFLIAPGIRAAGRIQATDWFQPHAGATYQFTPEVQGYAGFTQATRAFTSASTGGPFATSQTGFDALIGGQNGVRPLRPEQSDIYEAGVRFKRGGLSGSLGGYYVNFQNRILAQTVGAGIVGNPAILQNVGAVRSYGLEAAAQLRLGYGFSAYASYSYNDSTYRDNVGAQLIAGKTVVDSPRNLAKGELSYDSDLGLFGRVGVDYMSRRYFTYTNDQSVPGRALVEATLGYTIKSGQFEGWAIQGNVTNLFDLSYVATVGSNGFGYAGDNQTLLAGAPRQFFVTLKTRLR